MPQTIASVMAIRVVFDIGSPLAGVGLALPVSLVTLDVAVALAEDVAAAVTAGVAIGVIAALGIPETG